ncbi:hypothetical protein, partial [Acinetobacter baumannii]
QAYTAKIKLKNFNSFHILVKQTFNQPLLIYNICCALYALINSLFLIYRNKVFIITSLVANLFNIKWNFIYGLKKANRDRY